MSSVNPLNAVPESEAFVDKADAFFGGSSYSPIQIANRLRNERTTVVSDFAGALGVPASNPDVVQIAKVCDRYVNSLNTAKTKRFQKDTTYSVATL